MLSLLRRSEGGNRYLILLEEIINSTAKFFIVLVTLYIIYEGGVSDKWIWPLGLPMFGWIIIPWLRIIFYKSGRDK